MPSNQERKYEFNIRHDTKLPQDFRIRYSLEKRQEARSLIYFPIYDLEWSFTIL